MHTTPIFFTALRPEAHSKTPGFPHYYSPCLVRFDTHCTPCLLNSAALLPGKACLSKNFKPNYATTAPIHSQQTNSQTTQCLDRLHLQTPTLLQSPHKHHITPILSTPSSPQLLSSNNYFFGHILFMICTASPPLQQPSPKATTSKSTYNQPPHHPSEYLIHSSSFMFGPNLNVGQ